MCIDNSNVLVKQIGQPYPPKFLILQIWGEAWESASLTNLLEPNDTDASGPGAAFWEPLQDSTRSIKLTNCLNFEVSDSTSEKWR